MRSWLGAMATALLATGGGVVLAQSAARPLDDSQPPELAADDGRAALRRRMSRHGAMFDELVMAALRVDHARLAELAGGLERDTGLGAWPGADAGVAGRKALERLESDLRSRAHALADVARRRADSELPASFGSLMETCVRCHDQVFPGLNRGSSPHQ